MLLHVTSVFHFPFPKVTLFLKQEDGCAILVIFVSRIVVNRSTFLVQTADFFRGDNPEGMEARNEVNFLLKNSCF